MTGPSSWLQIALDRVEAEQQQASDGVDPPGARFNSFL